MSNASSVSKSTPILELRSLTKRYKTLTAVDGLNLSVREGICFGLLGPNGAGKTTTLEMIEGILPPTSGEILYLGKPVGKEFRQQVGIQFQSTALPERILVSEVLTLFSSFYKVRADLLELRKLCDLDEFWNRDASQLSGGQRQRLLLALALVNDPRMVFLDEPTTGLDPSARRRFWELVKLIRSQGKTIVLTTHYMEEAYELCDEIAIMDRGKVIAQGSPDQLLQHHFQGLSIRIPKTGLSLEAFDHLQGEVFDRTDAYEIQTTEPESTMRGLLDRKIPLQGIQIRTKNLEDLFLKLTGKGITP
ncbi:MAG: ABC transporter ATP-binding protein [Methylotenera sp.]|nr:ABC transporter ATP-binding protein [Oligoflexia bacterium]